MKRVITLAAVTVVAGHSNVIAGYRVEGAMTEVPLRSPAVVAAPVPMAVPATATQVNKYPSAVQSDSALSARIQALEAENAQLRARLKAAERQLDTQEAASHKEVKTVGFASGETKLSHRVSRKAQILELARTASSIEIVGYTDNTGSASINKHIALARAKFVKNMLVENGVSPNIITIREEAGVYCATNSTAEGRAANRRALVSFQ